MKMILLLFGLVLLTGCACVDKETARSFCNSNDMRLYSNFEEGVRCEGAQGEIHTYSCSSIKYLSHQCNTWECQFPSQPTEQCNEVT